MKSENRSLRSWLVLAAGLFCACSSTPTQESDDEFHARVTSPAYAQAGPRVLFDEAHNNFHTIEGRYAAFVELLRSDGYVFEPNLAPFSAQALDGFDILLIAGAAGGAGPDEPLEVLAQPAFSAEECQAVAEWVRGGGALLLLADHAPNGAAAGALAEALGVGMRNVFTHDLTRRETGQGSSTLAYASASGLADHSITNGREAAERVEKVVTFTGQSLAGPVGSTSLLQLSDDAVDYANRDLEDPISAAGRSQGLAFDYGDGRVIVFGEAAMLTAQRIVANGSVRRFGMSYAACDNRQFALNAMHWLSRL
jgi:hypothetical protein